MTARQSAGPPANWVRRGRSLAGAADWLVPAGWLYFILIGGTAPGEAEPLLRLANAVLAIVVILAWVRIARGPADTLDRLVVLGLLLFLVAAVTARSPRPAFDAALGAAAYAGVFALSRSALRPGLIRNRMALWLGTAGVVLAMTYAVLWILVWSHLWLAGQPMRTLLTMALPAGPYGSKHNVALLSALLVPFLWMTPASRVTRPMRVIGATVLVVLLAMSASRGLWLALVAASVVAAVTQGVAHRSRRGPGLPSGRWGLLVGMGVGVVIVVAILFPELPRAVAERVSNVFTVGARLRLWEASLAEWRSAPLTGVGPGGWPIWLPETGYFDFTTFSPSHPDSMPLQLLAETGLLGCTAVLLMLIGLTRSLRRPPPLPAIWAVVFLASACWTANPTDLPYAAALGTAWLAMALPRSTLAPTHATPRRRETWIRATHALAFGIIALFIGMTSFAGLLHEQARGLAEAGDLAAAERAMQMVVRLDPGLALYHRELASLRVAEDDLGGAEAELRAAARLNPADDITMTGLAVVLSLEDRGTEAAAAATRAVSLRRAAPLDHLVLSAVADRAGDLATASSALADSLATAPWLAGDPGWAMLRGQADLGVILQLAATRSISMSFSLGTGNAVWLAAMSGRADLLPDALAGVLQHRQTFVALSEVFVCDLPRARTAIRAASQDDAGAWQYGLVLAMIDAAGSPTSGSVAPAEPPASAFDARADDQWVYDRVPIRLPGIGPRLPSDSAGLAGWRTNPQATAQVGAPSTYLARCRG